MRAQLHPTSHRIASRRVLRAVTLLTRAGRQLDSPSKAAPDRYNRERLRFFVAGFRDLANSFSLIASQLERGGAR
jgi:hypothetical protein